VSGDKRFVYVLKTQTTLRTSMSASRLILKRDWLATTPVHCPDTTSRRKWRLHVVIEFSDEKRAIRFERCSHTIGDADFDAGRFPNARCVRLRRNDAGQRPSAMRDDTMASDFPKNFAFETCVGRRGAKGIRELPGKGMRLERAKRHVVS
jgi:hypothetical protein